MARPHWRGSWRSAIRVTTVSGCLARTARQPASRSWLRRSFSVRVVRRRPRLLFQPRPLAEAEPLDLDAEEVATCLEALCAVRVP